MKQLWNKSKSFERFMESMMSKARVTQNHHIMPEFEYKRLKDVTTRCYKGEHEILTKVQRYCAVNVSRAFLDDLKLFIAIAEAGGRNIHDLEAIPEIK